MARKRNISPGFFRNEDIADLDIPTRLLFIGLWTLADRAGRLEDRPRRIWVEIFPMDQDLMDEVDGMLDKLSRPGNHSNESFIVRYQVAGVKYIQIRNFEKHQSPHPKEIPSRIPPPGEPEPDKYLLEKNEKFYKNAWASFLGGVCEVSTDVGVIDIETDSHVWEVKEASLWKAGLGQAVAYGQAKGKKSGVILFGPRCEEFFEPVSYCLKSLGVEALFDHPGSSMNNDSSIHVLRMSQASTMHHVASNAGSSLPSVPSVPSVPSGSLARPLAAPTEQLPKVYWDNETNEVEIDRDWLRAEIRQYSLDIGSVLTEEDFRREKEALRRELLRDNRLKACLVKADGKPSSPSKFKALASYTVSHFKRALDFKAGRNNRAPPGVGRKQRSDEEFRKAMAKALAEERDGIEGRSPGGSRAATILLPPDTGDRS
jgi:hypothetical protein